MARSGCGPWWTSLLALASCAGPPSGMRGDSAVDPLNVLPPAQVGVPDPDQPLLLGPGSTAARYDCGETVATNPIVGVVVGGSNCVRVSDVAIDPSAPCDARYDPTTGQLNAAPGESLGTEVDVEVLRASGSRLLWERARSADASGMVTLAGYDETFETVFTIATGHAIDPSLGLVVATVLDCDDRLVDGAALRVARVDGTPLSEADGVAIGFFQGAGYTPIPGIGHTTPSATGVVVNVPGERVLVQAWARASTDAAPQMVSCVAANVGAGLHTHVWLRPTRGCPR